MESISISFCVLGETANTEHTVESAGLFVAVDGAEFGQSNGQIAVASRCGTVHLDVVRTIHGFQQEAFVLMFPAAEGGVLFFAAAVDWEVRGVKPEQFGGFEKFAFRLAGRCLQFGIERVEPTDPVIDELSGGVTENGGELRIAVVGEVAAGFVHFDAADVW